MEVPGTGQEGVKLGIERGAEQTLINLIIAKLNKGMDTPSIAEMLETDEDYIKELIEKHELMAVKS